MGANMGASIETATEYVRFATAVVQLLGALAWVVLLLTLTIATVWLVRALRKERN